MLGAAAWAAKGAGAGAVLGNAAPDLDVVGDQLRRRRGKQTSPPGLQPIRCCVLTALKPVAGLGWRRNGRPHPEYLR